MIRKTVKRLEKIVYQDGQKAPRGANRLLIDIHVILKTTYWFLFIPLFSTERLIEIRD